MQDQLLTLEMLKAAVLSWREWPVCLQGIAHVHVESPPHVGIAR